MFELATVSFKLFNVVFLELPSLNEDSEHSKNSRVGALEIAMSISCKYDFRANWQLD